MICKLGSTSARRSRRQLPYIQFGIKGQTSIPQQEREVQQHPSYISHDALYRLDREDHFESEDRLLYRLRYQMYAKLHTGEFPGYP